MRTRCKFQVEKVTRYSGAYEQVTLNAVHGGTAENESFAAATPSGKLEITVTNTTVIGKIVPGAYYYVDLVPTEA